MPSHCGLVGRSLLLKVFVFWSLIPFPSPTNLFNIFGGGGGGAILMLACNPKQVKWLCLHTGDVLSFGSAIISRQQWILKSRSWQLKGAPAQCAAQWTVRSNWRRSPVESLIQVYEDWELIRQKQSPNQPVYIEVVQERSQVFWTWTPQLFNSSARTGYGDKSWDRRPYWIFFRKPFSNTVKSLFSTVLNVALSSIYRRSSKHSRN